MYFLMPAASPLYSEDEGSFQLSLFEEEFRQRSSIVFDIDEDDYLVSRNSL